MLPKRTFRRMSPTTNLPKSRITELESIPNDLSLILFSPFCFPHFNFLLNFVTTLIKNKILARLCSLVPGRIRYLCYVARVRNCWKPVHSYCFRAYAHLSLFLPLAFLATTLFLRFSHTIAATIISAEHSTVDPEAKHYPHEQDETAPRKFYFTVTTRHNNGSPVTHGGAALVAAIFPEGGGKRREEKRRIDVYLF
jgi:hypothetical protein